MGAIKARAFVIGTNGAREFEFLADGELRNFVGLPRADIAALGLPKFPGGKGKVITPTGASEKVAYGATMRIADDRAPAIVVESPAPFIGLGVLENLRMKVNPATQELEKTPPDEHMPHYYHMVGGLVIGGPIPDKEKTHGER